MLHDPQVVKIKDDVDLLNFQKVLMELFIREQIASNA